MDLATRLRSLAGPAACFGCGRRGLPLCPGCRVRIPTARVVSVPRTTAAIAAWSYAGAARSLILGLKLGAARAAAEPLVDAMSAAARRTGLMGEVVTWVPGRRRDIAKRGFDHARVLAEGLASELGLPPVPLLTRISEPPDQVLLSADERRTNVIGAFAAVSVGKMLRVILVDDLMTTGATATECTSVLIGAGHSVEIAVPCAAR